LTSLGSAGRCFRIREDGVPDIFALFDVQLTWGAAGTDNSSDQNKSEQSAEFDKSASGVASADSAALDRLKYPSLFRGADNSDGRRLVGHFNPLAIGKMSLFRRTANRKQTAVSCNHLMEEAGCG
jgi:hypothetical protein